MKIRDRKITLSGVLKLADNFGNDFFPLTRSGAYKLFYKGIALDLEDYFPSEIERMVIKLERHGWVKKIKTKEGIRVEITADGKKQLLMYDLEKLKPKTEKWDGKWRIVFFDIAEIKRRTRNSFRRYLKILNFWQIQRSVWINPYNYENEIKYIREILEIPHEVKVGTLEKVENESELKKHFNLD
jgi:CRISPR-associated endonuclease Cas2